MRVMDKHAAEIKNILKEETGLFDRLYTLERTKTSAIIEHNGSLLEKLSLEQEGLFSNIMVLETDRMKRVDEFKKSRKIHDRGVSLNDIAARMDAPAAEHMRLFGRNLKDMMQRLRRLQETNRVLINDNMEYYNILLTGLRRTGPLDTGYGRDGKEEENLKNSILFNKRA
jgi:hypothetical protein